jgi:hypothetical protein
MTKICDECETVLHCSNHGCIPKQQALDKKAENARELGLDYEPVIEMAREAGWDDHHAEFDTRLKRFAELVRADERNSWPLEMEAMERQVNILTDALAQEREACAGECDEWIKNGSALAEDIAAAIRNRSNT